MDRAAKRELVSTLHDVFKDTGVVVVAHYAGMTVAQMTDYRQKIKAAGGKVKVAKNRLAKLALEDTSSAGIADLFTGPTCVAFSKDPIAAAKVAVAIAVHRLEPARARRGGGGSRPCQPRDAWHAVDVAVAAFDAQVHQRRNFSAGKLRIAVAVEIFERLRSDF